VTSELLESSFFQIIVVGRGIGGSAAAFRAAHHSSCPWGPASCARAAEGRHGISRRHSGIRADDAAGRVHDRSSGRLSTREEPGLLPGREGRVQADGPLSGTAGDHPAAPKTHLTACGVARSTAIGWPVFGDRRRELWPSPGVPAVPGQRATEALERLAKAPGASLVP
jgi:hypothetical protein